MGFPLLLVGCYIGSVEGKESSEFEMRRVRKAKRKKLSVCS
jgi:hypothetical protein